MMAGGENTISFWNVGVTWMIFMETIRMKVNMMLCSYSSIFDNQSNSISLSLSSWEGEMEITIEVLPNVFKN